MLKIDKVVLTIVKFLIAGKVQKSGVISWCNVHT